MGKFNMRWEGDNIQYVLDMIIKTGILDIEKIMQDTGMSKSMIRRNAPKLARENGWYIKGVTTTLTPEVIKKKYCPGSVSKDDAPIEAKEASKPVGCTKYVCKVLVADEVTYLTSIAPSKSKATTQVRKSYKGVHKVLDVYTAEEFYQMKGRLRSLSAGTYNSNPIISHFRK